MIDEGYIRFSCDWTAAAEQRLFKHQHSGT